MVLPSIRIIYRLLFIYEYMKAMPKVPVSRNRQVTRGRCESMCELFSYPYIYNEIWFHLNWCISIYVLHQLIRIIIMMLMMIIAIDHEYTSPWGIYTTISVILFFFILLLFNCNLLAVAATDYMRLKRRMFVAWIWHLH